MAENPTTATKVHRFGKVVEAPEITGVTEVEEIPIPDDLAEAFEGAIRDGNSQQLENLMPQVPPGARVSKSPTRKAESLLHLAAELGYFKCAKVLVNIGKIPIDISLQDKTQPLHHAAHGAHEAAIVFFVENGADIECKNVQGETPLHLAAKSSNIARADLYLNCINRMVQLNANIECKDNSECTPLLKAAQSGKTAVVKCLLKAKADPQAQDMFSNNALDLAEEFGHMDLVSYLKSAKKSGGKKGDKKECIIS